MGSKDVGVRFLEANVLSESGEHFVDLSKLQVRN
jgi:hypothetical protein